MSLYLRGARSTDAGKLARMLSQAVSSNAWKPKLHSEAEDISHIGSLIDRGWVTVCERAGEVAGFLALDGATVQSLYVAQNAQKQGIGTTLLKAAQAKCDRLTLWTFEANEGAQRFYARQGFTEAERTDGSGNEEGLPDIRMTWQRAKKESHDG